MLMTDNKGLKYLFDQPRQARWLAFLSEYNFEIQHIKGKENKVVDALSRNERLNFVEAINTYKTNLEHQLDEGVKLDENYQKLQAKVAKQLTKSLSTGYSVNESLSTGYSLNENGLILYKNRLYIPNVPKFKLLILNEIHKTPYLGHLGYQNTITMLWKIRFG